MLKEKLDRVWNLPGVADPVNKARWTVTCLGWIRWVRRRWWRDFHPTLSPQERKIRNKLLK